MIFVIISLNKRVQIETNTKFLKKSNRTYDDNRQLQLTTKSSHSRHRKVFEKTKKNFFYFE